MVSKIPIYESIQVAIKSYDTNTRPILIHLNDYEFNLYVVKHSNGRIPASKLANELIASFFLKIWGIKTPDSAFVQVNTNHLDSLDKSLVQPSYFKIPCWGTHFYQESTEFLQFFNQTESWERKKFVNPLDLLKIALFDLWVSNDDRTSNNPNILVVAEKEGFEFLAIDHEAIFNGNNLEKGLYELNLYDSLIYHPAVKRILGKKMNNQAILDEILTDAKTSILECEENIPLILSFIPNEWGLDVKDLELLLKDNLFNLNWGSS